MKLKSDYGTLNGYSVENSRNKSQFLNDGMKLGNLLRRELGVYGYEVTTERNKGGMAVSGEVYIRILVPESNVNILIQVGTSAIRNSILGRQSDGAVITIQFRARRTNDRTGSIGTIILGHNIYNDASIDSSKLISNIIGLADQARRWPNYAYQKEAVAA